MICQSQAILSHAIDRLRVTENYKMGADVKGVLDGILKVAVKVQNGDAIGCLINAGAGIPFKLADPSRRENALHIAAL